MPIPADQLSDPAVRAFVAAVNAQDKPGFLGLLTPDATMSDDGSERDLLQWVDREVFGVGGHMDVVSEGDAGRTLVVDYRNDTWGSMRTAWRFHVTPQGLVERFETGQA
ncbi:nuclear transport factor 2 family protein [Streptomyces sp. BI20]|uniref:nuclear transport factor 2 family protein n=1 Tax=Streptomyces sp. BI20 TaxID=3403460 RepID=UPI003C7470C4